MEFYSFLLVLLLHVAQVFGQSPDGRLTLSKDYASFVGFTSSYVCTRRGYSNTFSFRASDMQAAVRSEEVYFDASRPHDCDPKSGKSCLRDVLNGRKLASWTIIKSTEETGLGAPIYLKFTTSRTDNWQFPSINLIKFNSLIYFVSLSSLKHFKSANSL